MVVALVAMLYSVYAIYASGKDAVMGGMLVMGIGYIIWGFIAPRFATAADRPRAGTLRAASGQRGRRTAFAARIAWRRRCSPARAAGAAAGTLDRVKSSGKLTLGYRADTRPFSYQDGVRQAGRLRDRRCAGRSPMR